MATLTMLYCLRWQYSVSSDPELAAFGDNALTDSNLPFTFMTPLVSRLALSLTASEGELLLTETFWW